MANKILTVIFIVLAIAALVLTLRFLIGGDEDTWICDKEKGEWVKHGSPYAEKPAEPCGNNFQDNNNGVALNDSVRLVSPKSGDTISSPLIVKGEARGSWYFEASFPVKILNEKEEVLAAVPAQAGGDWMTENFVPFETEISFDAKGAKTGFLVLEKDNPSGLPENSAEVRIPVNFSETETITIRAYFNNSILDPEASCNKVFPVERKVAKTQAVARVALEELLKGPASVEKKCGFATSINPGVKINSLTIENGVARVDFDGEMERAVGGSCRVSAIRAQITETLKQFSTVNSVIMSVNGRTEDILQP
ncbi:MAG: GerMN domain-containing protein [Candidatus Pacebacteria bacterium]|nr:GerMN domain-containing protein [Candidatus Paceibacterota bacterium]